jgi:hypothetical protein|mmetsp:Transcript_34871/g.58294  ORF Transcript_34871/g.58294 Transcript_34871/m.58294 type:complete len:108 (+) Transcript_34871:1004-1327(+)
MCFCPVPRTMFLSTCRVSHGVCARRTPLTRTKHLHLLPTVLVADEAGPKRCALMKQDQKSVHCLKWVFFYLNFDYAKLMSSRVGKNWVRENCVQIVLMRANNGCNFY